MSTETLAMKAKQLRIIHLAMMGGVLLLAALAYLAVKTSHIIVAPLLVNGMGVIAFTAGVAAFLLRSSAAQLARQLGAPGNSLDAAAEDAPAKALYGSPVDRWLLLNVFAFLLADVISFMGFALHALGVSRSISALFFVASFLLLAYLTPRWAPEFPADQG